MRRITNPARRRSLPAHGNAQEFGVVFRKYKKIIMDVDVRVQGVRHLLGTLEIDAEVTSSSLPLRS
jgi:hypothetical protein